MRRTVYLARPRLDCSFKPGPTPAAPGPPLNGILAQFGEFLDRLQAYHEDRGDRVIVDVRPLWQFGLEEMQKRARTCDRLYFPHKLRAQFPIGPNAFFYKNAPLGRYATVDAQGWGASLSFLPLEFEPGEAADTLYAFLQTRLERNESIFDQPPRGAAPVESSYDLFVCQLPHDETIRFHSDVSVAEALSVVIAHCEASERCLVVKGHPANRKSMLPLKALADASAYALWVDDVSIHSCMAFARRVYMVNSGSGMEALLHDRPLIRFGRAEYDSVTPKADLTVDSVAQIGEMRSDTRTRAAFISAYLSRCVALDEPASFARILERLD